MKRFIIRSLLYLIPLLLVIGAVAIVDPYYLFHNESPFNEQKYEIGYSFDQGRRYKIFTYWNNPTDKIILGASEINIINERNIPEDGWHSLSYGGAPLQESLRMYWEISKEHHLTKVLIAPEFVKYYNAISSANGDPYYANFTWETSQSAKALEIYNNRLDYFIDKYTLKATWQFLSNSILHQGSRGKPEGSKDAFWKHQLDYARDTYKGIIIEEKKMEIITSFRELKKDADSKNIEVMIVIPIQHVDLLREEFGDDVYEVYVEYMLILVDIFGGINYLAYYDGISDDAESFSDPFHCTTEGPYLDCLFGNTTKKLIGANEIKPILETIKRKLNSNE